MMNYLLCVIIVVISLGFGFIFGKAFALDDAVKDKCFRFAGKVYNVERVE